MYHYTECGLDDIYLVNGFTEQKTPYGGGLSIEDMDGLHAAIGTTLVHSAHRLNGREIRFLRHQLDLSQKNLAGTIGVSDQQIARYEKGTSKIPGPTDRLIRVLYIAKLDGHERISELLELLAELDQVESGKLEFEETKDGWQVAA